MERTSDGRILLSPEDEEGVNALILSETNGVVSICATTDERISAFVRRWELRPDPALPISMTRKAWVSFLSARLMSRNLLPSED